jgi:hypothetical protein
MTWKEIWISCVRKSSHNIVVLLSESLQYTIALLDNTIGRQATDRPKSYSHLWKLYNNCFIYIFLSAQFHKLNTLIVTAVMVDISIRGCSRTGTKISIKNVSQHLLTASPVP